MLKKIILNTKKTFLTRRIKGKKSRRIQSQRLKFTKKNFNEEKYSYLLKHSASLKYISYTQQIRIYFLHQTEKVINMKMYEQPNMSKNFILCKKSK